MNKSSRVGVNRSGTIFRYDRAEFLSRNLRNSSLFREQRVFTGSSQTRSGKQLI